MTTLKSSHLIMVVLVAAWLVVNMVAGEIVPEGSGLGWDGKIYAEMIRAFPANLTDESLSPYYAGRLLPVAGIALALKLLTLSPSIPHIIAAFQLWNLAAMLASVFVWTRIANALELSLRGRWLGFAALFLTFQAAKQTPYDPVLIDPTAILVGLLMIWLAVERRPIALATVGMISAFCWPTASITAAGLLWFMGKADDRVVAFRPGLFVAGIAAVTLTAIALYLIASVPAVCANVPQLAGRDLCRAARSFATGFPSMAILATAAVILVGRVPSLWPASRANALLAALVLVASIALRYAVGNPDVSKGMDARTFIGFAIFPDQIGKFLLPFVALAIYFGPLMILAMLRWEDVSLEARRLGWGFVGAILLSLPLALVSEPRYFTLVWPFIATCAILATERFKLSTTTVVGIAILALLFSRAWLPINVAPWTGGEKEGLYEFPKQLWFMNFGFWMNWTTFLSQAVLLTLTGLWLRRRVISDLRRAGPEAHGEHSN